MRKLYVTLSFFLIFCLWKQSPTAQTFSYLGTFNSEGVPNYLESPGDVISSAVLQRIHTTLPEGYNLEHTHPEFITAGADTDLKLQQDADVWVTFLGEGAGYRSVLGYFTYSLNATTVSTPSNITVIFPNVSAVNSGGGLVPGNKVKIGHFSAGTGICWVLASDGFRGGTATHGNWLLYSHRQLNPESTDSLRHHTVLLRDLSGVIVLGFEDIRRDYGGCDHDFNDVLFNVTTNPSSAFNASTLHTTTGTSGGASGSGSDGGLESNGGLASAIAKRNFQRRRTPAVSEENMPHFKPLRTPLNDDNDLQQFIPLQPIANAVAKVSTPTDLTSVTNAKYVFSVDYLIENERKAAVLATKTEGKVYEHTKVICDRFRGSTLVDVQLVHLDSFNTIPMYILQDENGNSEYALSFSAILTGDSIRFETRWTVEEYEKEPIFYNFQVWSKTSLWTLQTATEVMNLFKEKYKWSPNGFSTSTTLPAVYVKKGEYKNERLNLSIQNGIAARSLKLRGTKTRTETSPQETFELNVPLDGATDQTVEVPIGSVFDAGFRLINDKDAQADALYLADGAWGTDYEKTKARVDKFEVTDSQGLLTASDVLSVNRNVALKGNINSGGYVSLFRGLRPSSAKEDVSAYNNLYFEASGNGVLEITLVKSSISAWTDQYRSEITLGDAQRPFNLALSNFTNGGGKPFTGDDLTTVVFTLHNNNAVAQPFGMNMDNVHFDKQAVVSPVQSAPIYASPSLTATSTTLNFTLEERGDVQIEVFAVATGQRVFTQSQAFAKGQNQTVVDLTPFASGVYVAQVAQAKGRASTKIVKQ